MEYGLPQNGRKTVICSSMDGTTGHCIKRSKPDAERQAHHRHAPFLRASKDSHLTKVKVECQVPQTVEATGVIGEL